MNVFISVFPIARQLGVTDDERRKKIVEAIDDQTGRNPHHAGTIDRQCLEAPADLN